MLAPPASAAVSALPSSWRAQSWVPVEAGCSGAVVLRSEDGRHHLKAAGGAARSGLEHEVVTGRWLDAHGITCPVPVEVVDADPYVVVTRTVPGVPACDVAERDVPATLPALAEVLRDLHELPVDECPIDMRVDRLVETCEGNVAAGRIDVDERTATGLLAEVHDGLPRARELQTDDLVVTHGDACLPNLLVDPETLRPTGFVDLGLLGVSDRHRDLALLTRSIASPDMNLQYSPDDAERLLSLMGGADPWRIAYYRLVDELF